jgi:hypothetical protein
LKVERNIDLKKKDREPVITIHDDYTAQVKTYYQGKAGSQSNIRTWVGIDVISFMKFDKVWKMISLMSSNDYSN